MTRIKRKSSSQYLAEERSLLPPPLPTHPYVKTPDNAVRGWE